MSKSPPRVRKHPSTTSQAAIAARRLLRAEENGLPEGVERTLAFFEEHGLWYRLSRNIRVRSCREAALNRYRLGKIGIALADELRSYAANVINASGGSRRIILHCRADRQFDLARVEALGFGRVVKIEANAGDDTVAYGLVNPFLQDIAVMQVFDEEVPRRMGETGTMMTNAGDLEWAIEFDPKALTDVMRQRGATVAPIAGEALAARQRAPKTLAIITGNSPESGALLWHKVNSVLRDRLGEKFRGDASYPHVIVRSLPEMGWSMELDARAEPLWSTLSAVIEQVLEDGAEVLALACNTTQYYKDRIEKLLAGRGCVFASMDVALERWERAARPRSVFVAAIGYVLSRGPFGPYERFADEVRYTTPGPEQTALIEQLAYEVKQRGPDGVNYQKYRKLLRSAPQDVVLLMLTELSQIKDRYPRSGMTGKVVFDSLDVYADLIVDQLTNGDHAND